MQADYTIHAHHQHLSWDNARPPAVTVTPGETVEFRDIDALCGQITPQSTAADLANLDFARIDPLAGPVYVDGADVGDALVVTPVGMDTAGWGWTAIIPGYGVLAEDFPAPSLHHWSYAPDLSAPAMFSGIAQVAAAAVLRHHGNRARDRRRPRDDPDVFVGRQHGAP